MTIKTTSLILIAMTIMSCNSGKNANSEANSQTTSTASDINSIENTRWVITTLERRDMSDTETNGQVIYFILDSKDNRVKGFTGCNTFMGTYTLEEGNRIKFSQMASTRMMCPDSKIDESQILKIFETADNFTISNGKLSLNKAKMAPLAVFKKVDIINESIVERYWKLKSLEGKDIKMNDNREQDIYFMLNVNENRVAGFAGCNTISGTYTLEKGNRIRFSQMATTLKTCPDVDTNETEFLKIFELADNYTISDDVLTLNVGRRAPLAVFEAVYK